MDTRVLEPLGVEVTGLSVADLRAEDVEGFRGLLAEHGVVVVPRQDAVDDDQFLAFLQLFGDMVFTSGETPLPGYRDLNIISNVGRTTPPRSTFHVDTSYVSNPPAYTSLRAVAIPTQGGQTVFSNQYAAYDTLPDDVRRRLDGRAIRHIVTGVDPGDEQESEAEHPVFRQHPISGRTSLYLTTPARCAEITGLDADETAEMITFLYEHSTNPANCYRHAWAPGDVVIWDNGCVMHRADHDGVVGDRVMHRGMVDGYAVA